jgi:hypothetical protein
MEREKTEIREKYEGFYEHVIRNFSEKVGTLAENEQE